MAHWRAWSMRTARGAEFVTGKLEGAGERLIAEEDGGGVCWTRDVEMLFTANVSLELKKGRV